MVLAFGQANSSLRLPIDLDLEQPLPGFDSIASALEDLAAGKLIVVLDDEDRENEGDLIMNADKVTTETMAFLVEHTSGVVCISMEGRDLDRLRLPLMVSSAENEESMYTAFTITVDLRDGITTGISAADRAKTIRRLADPNATAGDFRRPGHIFPLRYRPGGVLVRPGHTEAAVDLARLSGSFPAGVLCELVNKEDGSMARTPQLLDFARRHGLRCVTIADLIRYRLRQDALVAPACEPSPVIAGVASGGAAFTAHCFRSTVDGTEHLAFVHGAVADSVSDVLVYIHQERTVGDLLNAPEPPGPSGFNGSGTHSLNAALGTVAQAGAGVVLYLRGQTARGLAPSTELAALGGNSSSGGGGGRRLYSWDLKDAAIAAQMLQALGVRSVALAGAAEEGSGSTAAAGMATALRSCGMSVRQVLVPAPAQVAAAAVAPQHNGNGNGAGHVRGGPQQPLQTAGHR
ncbi:hypothetical protein VOLCADRAFT_61351 [Volvox carteri f. nagariensis]|uniref:3,4-dihydroxy-2-butanone-4-phosphate synthase n=1 Tax=Volvox carteri f. nagariensis TaxID=3068 RepID=D8TYB6_VOLCA|nr:uncharacterized protein VOLCADRAFT_61351 [Volvox carteri f. nagariensis]EFJ47614.1 hypothetical protein VOLCADRAFT_61351 [Volvox carteri f. nagariensis]|eukprot:XP_002951438.1 hypothetical protein VOLCADRAFT_61351 [Volvox carteri f. nagariensis]